VRKIIITGLFAAVLAACATTAAPAMAHEFVASQSKGSIQDKGGKQVFKTGLLTVECESETSVGVVQAKHSPTNREAVEYSECKALGLPANVTQAKYIFSAEGTVEITDEVKVTIPKEGCEIAVPGGQKLSKITYNNNQQNGTIEIKAEVSGIKAILSGTGALCPKGTSETSKYEGASTVFFNECLPVGKPNGSYQDPWCQTPLKGGQWQEIPGKLYWV
jgi:predicted metal-binding protein